MSSRSHSSLGGRKSARNLVRRGAGLFFALSFMSAASAADLVFDPIPINVTSMGGVTSVSVSCYPMDVSGNPLHGLDAPETLPHPRVGTIDATGKFSGILATNFNYDNKADAAKAKKWHCMLMCTNASGSVKDCQVGDGSQFYHVKSGTLTAEGLLP